MRNKALYCDAAAMYSTAAHKSVSEADVPPRAGIALLSSTEVACMASMPVAIHGAQAFLSPNFGALATPVRRQTWQACLYKTLPAPLAIGTAAAIILVSGVTL